MADYTGTYAAGNAGVQIPERSGTTSGDTVPAGALVVWRNTGAGTHVVTITTNNTQGGLAVADQPITIPAGQTWAGRIRNEWGDANGRCAVGIDGTASEVKYYVMGGI